MQNGNKVKQEALKLAKELDAFSQYVPIEAPDMIRKLVNELDKRDSVIYSLIANWSDDFKNYKYDSDNFEENKLRNDVFAILKKASEK